MASRVFWEGLLNEGETLCEIWVWMPDQTPFETRTQHDSLEDGAIGTSDPHYATTEL